MRAILIATAIAIWPTSLGIGYAWDTDDGWACIGWDVAEVCGR